jgi:hypothetical protein
MEFHALPLRKGKVMESQTSIHAADTCQSIQRSHRFFPSCTAVLPTSLSCIASTN